MAAAFLWKKTGLRPVLLAPLALLIAVSLALGAPPKHTGGKPSGGIPAPAEPIHNLQTDPADPLPAEPTRHGSSVGSARVGGVSSSLHAAGASGVGSSGIKRTLPGSSAVSGAGPRSAAKAAAPGRAASPATGTALVVDPCTFVTAAKLKALLAPYVGVLKFEYHKDGHHLTMSDPSLSDLRCPGCKIEIRAKVRYQKTTGFPQFSASGTMRASARLEARVTMNGSQLQKAEVLVKNLKVTGLNLSGVNNAIDAEIRKHLDQKLPNQLPPIDVTGLVQTFLNQGGSFAASPSGKLGTNPTARKAVGTSPRVPGVPKLQP